MMQKLYISGLVALLSIGVLVVIVSTVLAAHDTIEFRSLPQAYRDGIVKLQQGWHYAGLPEDEQEAILNQHKQWKDDQRLPWWGSDPAVDPRVQKAETLSNFEKFVPRWGLRLHQQHPILAVAISFVAFVPVLVMVGVAKWLRWLRTPQATAG